MEAGLQDGWIVGLRLLPTARGNVVTFSTVNYLAILIAAAVAWLASAAWYMSLSGLYTAALGKTPEQMAKDRKKPGAFLPDVYALVANVIIAWMLAGLLAHLGAGQVTLRNGIISAAFLWFGFVLTTMTVNYSFSDRDKRLLLIDLGNWLIVLLVIGAVIGAMGA
jgi:Protein of unknown function (DUF1761)